MAKYTRKFPVQLEGQETPLFVASAMCGQTEEFLDEQTAAMKEEDLKKRAARLEKNAYTFLANCLNNAEEGTPNATKWTVERVRAELDKLLIDAAMVRAQKESGLVDPNEKTPSVQA